MDRHPHPRTGKPFASPVPAGGGWPGDPATEHTPVAQSAAQVADLALGAADVGELDALISVCAACPRLVAWREDVARIKRRAYADEPYWGRPISGWGSERPRIMILGLAPAAHGGNRTGRVFTGDRSGDQLFAALYRAGLVSSPFSADTADGLQTKDIRIVAAVRCAPPGNAPSPAERTTCEPWVNAEWRMIASHVRVVVALGGFAWQALLRLVSEDLPSRGKPKFGHAHSVLLPSGLTLIGCYHPSQQNMFTGRLTPEMLDLVFEEAAKVAGIRPDSAE